ncbi:unnamed protein product [Spirodela intermedia]|uniref:tRNA(Ile)-lysidine synthetase n=1 Tax=Spirodela intermedia TaxID=51605 RepID=A0A7I8J6X0_SPIIN|nr:unnamed protein product [Spirodela intermedia]CAA6665977.1 unnamed protein product [Spirodela intermedia]
MAMAGIKRHHRIALGVSGGPDSMALCILTAGWKSCGLGGKSESSGFIDGLLGIVVDHRLRPESTEEAKLVCTRVMKLGVQCQIASCDWSDGRPTRGHLQEAAREMRYQIFQDVCYEHSIGVLLVAHHADDQAELFILRLSRNSGVLGLAGMAFVSQSFPTHSQSHGGDSSRNGLLLVRPLLQFSKDDLYKICLGLSQEWVEDPSNQSLLFARNRIRMLLKNLSSDAFRSELQALISTCRLTRAYTEQICYSLVRQCVTVMDHGYAIIDLNKLDPSSVDDLCLSKFLAVVLQFISQRHRPVRGAASKLLLDYIRRIPCKASLTVASCYLSAVPKSKGTKIMVAAALDSPRPLEVGIPYNHSLDQPYSPNEVDEIISVAELLPHQSLRSSDVPPFVKATSPEATLKEAKELNIISESTFSSILSLQMEECQSFKARAESKDDMEAKHRMKAASISTVELHPGVSWKLCEKAIEDSMSRTESNYGLDEEPELHSCGSCVMGHDVAFIRHMVDDDWLYLANLSKNKMAENQNVSFSSAGNLEKGDAKSAHCSDFAQMSAQRALQALKSIPAPARRSLPVLVNSQGLLLCIPSICFSHCPDLTITARFEPRVPLGGL